MIEVKYGASTYILERETPTSLEAARNSGTPWGVYRLNSKGERGPKLDRDFYRNDIVSRIKAGAYEDEVEACSE